MSASVSTLNASRPKRVETFSGESTLPTCVGTHQVLTCLRLTRRYINTVICLRSVHTGDSQWRVRRAIVDLITNSRLKTAYYNSDHPASHRKLLKMQRVARKLAISSLRTSRWVCSEVQKCGPASLRQPIIFKQTIGYILSEQQNVRTAVLCTQHRYSLIHCEQKSKSVPRFLLILQLIRIIHPCSSVC